MNTIRFRHRSLKETIERLCAARNVQPDGSRLLKPDGTINQTNLGNKCNVDQSVINRVLQRVSGEIKAHNAKKIADFFKVTTAQLRGEEPIPFIDGTASQEDELFVERYRKAPMEVREQIRKYEAFLRSEQKGTS